MSLPIRVRLTAWYAALLAATMVGIGAFVVLALRSDLRAQMDREVQASSAELAREYRVEGVEDFLDISQTLFPRGDGVTQLLDGTGRGRTYGAAPDAPPIVSAPVRRAALAGAQPVATVVVSGERYRARASAVSGRDGRRVLVVAQSLRPVEQAVDRVLALLLLAGPAALAATAVGGWWLARTALAPVERMTSKARQIGIDHLHERLAVPSCADEIGRLAVTLNAMLDRLERGVAEKHQLIADASHELRTPLAVMRAELDVQLGEPGLHESAREVLESAREEVDRLRRIVENLLTLAEADEGRLGVLATRVELGEAIESAVGRLRGLAATKRIAIRVDGDDAEVRADPHRLQQVLTNYLENAVKFAPPGGEVRITSWSHGREAGVTVADDGPGIPAGDRPHVFDRFYRVDRARGREGGGSGLGLAICREVAVAHGGRVWVDSEEGRGSAFSLALPREERP